MKECLKSFLLIVLITVLVHQCARNEAGAEDSIFLLTEEEGAIADVPAGIIDAGTSLDTGPSIEVIKPEQNKAFQSPIEIIVRFIPNGKDVDLSACKVEVLKFLTIDITKRVLPYATREGIHVKSVSLPSGEHKLRVTIGDVGGGISQKIFLVKIL
jgi:hypothetical protein